MLWEQQEKTLLEDMDLPEFLIPLYQHRAKLWFNIVLGVQFTTGYWELQKMYRNWEAKLSLESHLWWCDYTLKTLKRNPQKTKNLYISYIQSEHNGFHSKVLTDEVPRINAPTNVQDLLEENLKMLLRYKSTSCINKIGIKQNKL